MREFVQKLRVEFPIHNIVSTREVKLKLFAVLSATCIFLSPIIANSTPTKKPPNVEKQAEAPFDPLISFRKLIANASTPASTSTVYFNEKRSKWTKVFVNVGNVQYDVKKTDSLVSPVVGVASFAIVMRQSEYFDTEEEAKLAQTTIPNVGKDYAVEANYAVTDARWRLRYFRVKDTISVPLITMTPIVYTEEQVNSNRHSSLEATLRKWLPQGE